MIYKPIRVVLETFFQTSQFRKRKRNVATVTVKLCRTESTLHMNIMTAYFVHHGFQLQYQLNVIKLWNSYSRNDWYLEYNLLVVGLIMDFLENYSRCFQYASIRNILRNSLNWTDSPHQLRQLYCFYQQEHSMAPQVTKLHHLEHVYNVEL